MQPDFEAKIRFLIEKRVGCRPQFKYLDDNAGDYDIWPIQAFTEEDEIGEGQPMPSECYARFYIINAQLRMDIHQKRIEPGLKFLMREGTQVIGEGEVTKILGLFDPR